MLEKDGYQVDSSSPEFEQIKPDAGIGIITAEQRASWMFPIARMLEHDILTSFSNNSQDITGVFIGPWNRGFIEANAFRIACTLLGVEPKTVFLIDINSSVIDESTDKTERERIHNALSADGETKHFMDVNVVRLGDNDFSVYTSRDFVDMVRGDQRLKLPPLIFVKGDAGDSYLAEAIVQTSHENSSLLIVGRNIDPIPFSYRQVVEVWAEQVKLRNRLGRMSFLAFTITDPTLAGKMYDYITDAMNGSYSNRDLQIFTPRSGLLLSSRPNLEDRGAHFSDSYKHIIGGLPNE